MTMELKAILCEAADFVGGRLYAIGGFGSERLYGPRWGMRGAVAGMLFDVPASQAGKRIRVSAQLGTSDAFDADSWKPVRPGGKPVRASRSISVEGPTTAFVLQLPVADLGRGPHAWKLKAGDLEMLLPGHWAVDGGGDVDVTPEGQLLLCDAAAVADGRLQMFGARSRNQIAPADTAAWALAGRLAVPSARGTPVETWDLEARLSGPGGSDVPGGAVQEKLEVPRPAKARRDLIFVEIPFALSLPAVQLDPGAYGCSVAAGGDLFEFVTFTVRSDQA